MLGSWTAGDWKQTADYTIPVAQQFPDLIFPQGEFMDHPCDFNTMRTTEKEYKNKDRLFESQINDLRRAAECHRQVRK